jgi:hypothetical protein
VASRSSSKWRFAEHGNRNYVEDKKRLLSQMQKGLNTNINTGGRKGLSDGS